jgi:hypothetical protein
MGFYLNYLARWPDICRMQESPSGRITSYSASTDGEDGVQRPSLPAGGAAAPAGGVKCNSRRGARTMAAPH